MARKNRNTRPVIVGNLFNKDLNLSHLEDLKMKRLAELFSVIFLLFFTGGNLAQAQGFGLEAGFAGVENYGPGEFNKGVSLLLPISGKVQCDISWYSWQGEDGNYSMDKERGLLSDAGLYIGNSGLNMLILYKIKENKKLSYFIGAGLAQYKINRTFGYDSTIIENDIFIGAFSIAAKVQHRLSNYISIYAKGILSSSGLLHGFAGIDYGFINVGISASPF